MYATRLAAVALGLAAGLGTIASSAGAMPVDAMSCKQLWVKRNAIYKANGYCFKTAKAINYFGNAGCSIDDMSAVPLSKKEMQRVLTFKHWEEVNGC
jgi:hypothetical protein